jgi:hypothetical protein
MAKGNDGNYLQHSIEVALAWQLVSRASGNGLHIALTHGMAPYEPTGSVPNGQAKALLVGALAHSRERRIDGEAPIISAYRATEAMVLPRFHAHMVKLVSPWSRTAPG